MLTRHSYTNLKPLSKTADTSQRRRRTESMLLHASLYTLRWTVTDRCHDIWKGLQAICKDKEGDRGFSTNTIGRCRGKAWIITKAYMGRRSRS